MKWVNEFHKMIQKPPPSGYITKVFLKKFRKIRRKAPVPDSLF